ncbi:MAG: Lrp/AsnC family transcriptional regulator [Crocinitomicaceae bacterium]|nr:Lrp/AsnC family transcriptional regulator [Crocinitomicaceae bacterium]MDG1775853.1 Lrp/AsnC family transcriptional regulator [Crocinitomicaceae bacterium]
MENKLDSIDTAILEILKENSKVGTKEIALQVGLTVTPTYERIKRLERSGVITGYTTCLNKKLIGKGLQVFCQVSLKGHSLDLLESFEKMVVSFEEVSTCYHIAGDHDYALLIEVSDMSEYEAFLKQRLATVPSIMNVQSSFVMSAIKE